jgi:hypothetical protein
MLQIFYQKVELQKGQNKNRVSGPGYGQVARECTPKFFVGVACASPYRDEDPGCVGGEARQENLPQRHATVIKRGNVEGDDHDAGGNPVDPEPGRVMTRIPMRVIQVASPPGTGIERALRRPDRMGGDLRVARRRR